MEDEESTTKPSSINCLAPEIGSNRGQLLHEELESSSIEEEEEEEEEEEDDDDDEARPRRGEKKEMAGEDSSSKEDIIIKELKIIQRQNTLTHYLLTASILITMAWQLSEYSLIWKIKQGFNNPLKSIAGAVKGLFNTIPQNHDHHNQIQVIPPTYLPGLKIPDLPGFDTSNDDDADD